MHAESDVVALDETDGTQVSGFQGLHDLVGLDNEIRALIVENPFYDAIPDPACEEIIARMRFAERLIADQLSRCVL